MKRKQGQRFNIHFNNELKEIFVGHHTLFSVVGFAVGGILIGGTVKEYLHMHVGLFPTLVVGLILMLISGMVLHKFSDKVTGTDEDDVL